MGIGILRKGQERERNSLPRMDNRQHRNLASLQRNRDRMEKFLEEYMHFETIIPLFPLNVVLMPGMPLPLHIFEERYKSMIGECLEESKEFGTVYVRGNELMKVGCTASILKILKRYENGEMDIITMGKSRFFIKEMYDRKPYFEAKIIFFDDVPEDEGGELIDLAREGIESLKELDEIIGIPRDYGTMEDLDAKRVSFLISGSEGLPLQEKQQLLEMTSTRERLKSGVRALQKVLERTTLNEEIQHIIGGNGNIKPFLSGYGTD